MLFLQPFRFPYLRKIHNHPTPLLILMRGLNPLPRPLPFQGEGCNRSYSSLLHYGMLAPS